jgi:hypothetical protein
MNKLALRLRSIPPVIGPCGDDLLLRAIHAALTSSSIPADSLSQPNPGWSFMTDAEKLGLVCRHAVDSVRFTNYLQYRPTEIGLLYWQSRGGDFTKFIYECPPVTEFAYQPAA